jgi:hypothetical protein
MLQNGAGGFTSALREGMLWKFIALKIDCPRPGLNPQTVCPVANMLTITALRMTANVLH